MSEKHGAGEKNKRYSKEDILSAGDVGCVLENYRRASEQVSQHYERAGLQTAAADRLHQLGDEEKSFQFTILASQSQNAEKISRAVETVGYVEIDFHRDVSSITSALNMFKQVGGEMTASSEKIRSAGNSIAASINNMSSASQVIDGAARRIESASGTISQASNRMGR